MFEACFFASAPDVGSLGTFMIRFLSYNLVLTVACTQVSHVSTECDYPLGAEAKDMIEDEWAVSQVCHDSVMPCPYTPIIASCFS